MNTLVTRPLKGAPTFAARVSSILTRAGTGSVQWIDAICAVPRRRTFHCGASGASSMIDLLTLIPVASGTLGGGARVNPHEAQMERQLMTSAPMSASILFLEPPFTVERPLRVRERRSGAPALSRS